MTLYQFIAGNRDCIEHFNRTEYSSWFTQLRDRLAEELDEMDISQEAVDVSLNLLEADWKAAGSRYQRMMKRENDKLVISLFFTPAAMTIPGQGEAVAYALKDAWDKRFPRNTYLIGDQEKIQAGFKRRLFELFKKNRSEQ